MSGIQSIYKRAVDSLSGKMSAELFLKEGDHVLVTIIPSGSDDNDNRLDEFASHSIRSNQEDGSTQFNTVFCLRSVGQGCALCDVNEKISRRFGFWAYVHFILHAVQRREEWVPISSAGGMRMYKEMVDAFKLIALGCGRDNALLNQLYMIYSENGSLNKGVIRISRIGQKLSTTYNINMTTQDLPLSNEILKKAKELPGVHEYYLNKLNTQKQRANPVALTSPDAIEQNNEVNDNMDDVEKLMKELF